MAFLLTEQLVKGIRSIESPVNSIFPHPVWATFSAARMSLAYQANYRENRVTPPSFMSYFFLAWGSIIITLQILQVQPYDYLFPLSPDYITYPATHLIVIPLVHIFPFLLSPSVLAVLDTLVFPLDALARTAAVTQQMKPRPRNWITRHPVAFILMELYLGALTSGDGRTSYLPSALSQDVMYPPFQHALMRASYFWTSMELWVGSLVAAVYGVAVGAEAFRGVQRILRPVVVSLTGIAEDGCVVGTPWMSPLEAKALAAGVLVVCFGLRMYKAFGLPPNLVKPREAAAKDAKIGKVHECDDDVSSASASKKQRLRR